MKNELESMKNIINIASKKKKKKSKIDLYLIKK